MPSAPEMVGAAPQLTATSAFRAIFLIIFIGGLCCRLLVNAASKRERRRKEAQIGCKPVPVLTRDGFLSRLTFSWEVLRMYRDGTRNSKLQHHHKTAGGTFRIHETSQIFTVDPENLKACFGGPADEWGVEPLRLEAFQPLTGPGILTTDGARWVHARKLCQMNLNFINKYRNSDLSRYDRSIRNLLALTPADGATVDMAKLFNRYMIDSSTEYIFGDAVGALRTDGQGDIGTEFVEAFVFSLNQVGERNEAWQITDVLTAKKLKDSCRIVHRVADRYVQRALDEANNLNDKLPADASLALMWAMSTKDPMEIRNQILNVLTAAFDTTAITLTNAVFHLARCPDCYENLHQEALTWDGKTLTGESIKNFKYLRAIIDETLRINTPATYNSRIALVDTKLPKGGGVDGLSPIFVPKGEVISTSVYSVQRDSEVFGKDADCFRPERWQALRPSNWEYLPFSVGQRVCPGQKLALAQSAYVMLWVARTFERLENRDPELEFVEMYKVSTSSRNGAQVAWYRQ